MSLRVRQATRERRAGKLMERMERIQKILSRAGVASRRAAEDLIREGRVRLNGKVVEHLGTRADPVSDKLTVKQGSVTNKADVDAVFEGQGVTGVVVALGGKTKDVGPTMLQDGTANIIAACKANGVKRISVVTSIGVGDSMDQAPWAFRLLMMTVMSSIMVMADKREP